ncbi:MAG: cytochrome c oxidase subunit II [Chloroflexi bacterium]|nr:cytochrome c oxidase subunit II [Chloroflexota bacterium]
MNGKTHGVILGLVWAVATAVGVAVVLSVGILPSPASDEAHTVDNAMSLLTALSVPIFTLVVIVLGYSMVRFRQRGEPTQDGPPIKGHFGLEVGWVVVTLGLVLFLAGYGTVGLIDIRTHAAHAGNELVVQARGSQWFWEFTYPEQKISTKEELVLPLGRPVRFEVSAADVVHSFWIPSFRMKIDAVPGMVTVVHATPNTAGNYRDDFNFRVQCAELCGLGHTGMTVGVTVVEPSQFEAWVARQSPRR